MELTVTSEQDEDLHQLELSLSLVLSSSLFLPPNVYEEEDGLEHAARLAGPHRSRDTLSTITSMTLLVFLSSSLHIISLLVRPAAAVALSLTSVLLLFFTPPSLGS